MFVAQAHSFAQQSRLAITLAWIAGYTNVLALLTCGHATSHVTGTVSQWGLDLLAGRWGLFGLASYLIAAFLLGAMLSALCTEVGRRRGWDSIYVLPMALQTLLLSAFAVGVELHDAATVESGVTFYLMTGAASIAMGLQNATITRISTGVVRTTHMTGVFTDLGLETVQFLFWLHDRRRLARTWSPTKVLMFARGQPTARRLLLLASIAGSFALGAGLGGLAFQTAPRLAMFPPVLFLVWIIFQDARAPICEIEASELGEEQGLGLPPWLAVFELRRGPQASKVHRLPNLLAWADRLPRGTRVVVLDLAGIVQIDANAALELRALMERFGHEGRRLLIAGLDGPKLAEVQRAGAGSTLDASNVCTDLELAIARGLMYEHEVEAGSLTRG